MNQNISALKMLLGFESSDETEILNHHSDLQPYRDEFHASIRNWSESQSFIPLAPDEDLIRDDFYDALISGEYGERFHNTLYRQILHWHRLRLNEDQLLILISRIWQELLHHSLSLGNPRLQRSLCLVVEITRILAVKIYHFNRKLQSIRRKSEHETARIHQAFSLLAANLPKDLVQAYVDHQEWLFSSISLILGHEDDKLASIPDSHECNLARWLERGGRALIPVDEQEQFETAHRQVHDIAKRVQHKFARQETGQIFALLSELEQASDIVGQVLLRCIDKSITQFASYDPLTKLRNRNTLRPVFEREVALATRFNRNVGAILLDIDRFKSINDEYGHLFGDQVLFELGQCLTQNVRQEDALFRWGGEEFLIIGLTDNSPGNSIMALAERLRQAVEESVFCNDTETPVQFTISAGVVEFNPSQNMPPMETIFDQADKFLYQAKQTGRNRVLSGFVSTP